MQMVRDMQTKELLFVNALMFDASQGGVGPSSAVFRLADSSMLFGGMGTYTA